MKLRIMIPAAVLAAALASLAAGSAMAQDSKAAANKPVTVNGKVISKAKMDFAVKARVAQGQPDNEQLRRAILDSLIAQELLAQEAERRGLLKNADSQVQLELSRQEVIANLAVQDHLKSNPIKEDVAKAEYEKVKAQRGTREYRARHILVETEAAARQIIDKLNKGEKFEDLARESKDPGSRERGGDLDWANPTNFVKPFSDAMIKLDKGKYTEAPVQSQFGWHVIRLDDTRSTQFPTFEQVKQQFLGGLQQQEIQKFIGDLRAKARIEAQ